MNNLAVVANAQSSSDALINRFISNVVDPIVLLLFSVAFLVFLYGIFKMIKNNDTPSELDTGKLNILYGIGGMLIMVLAWSIIDLVKGTFGIN